MATGEKLGRIEAGVSGGQATTGPAIRRTRIFITIHYAFHPGKRWEIARAITRPC